MTTTIPTRSDLDLGRSAPAAPEVPTSAPVGTLPGSLPTGFTTALPDGGASPVGVLDEAALARMANQLFAALPGRALVPSGELIAAPATSAAPARPASEPPGSGLATGELAAGAPQANGATYRPEQIAAADAAPTDGLFDIPSLFAPALPRVAPNEVGLAAPVALPGSPYYFIGDAVAHSASGRSGLEHGSSTVPGHAGIITPELPSLVNESALQQLLAATQRSDLTYRPATTQATPESHYFLKASQHGEPQQAQMPLASVRGAFDIHAIRRDFPILAERINGRPLIWLDNAATTHKPQAVIDRLAYFYAHENSNIHRAAHELAARATDAYEGARSKVARFLGAASVNEIIFVRGATEAINLIAQTFGKQFIKAGDEIIVSHLEHHANIVPWQLLAQQVGAVLRVIPVDDDGQVILSDYRRLLNERTRIVSVTQVSNALGTITPVKQIIDLAHQAGARVLIDGAQAVSHLRVNVQALDADFYVFSGHKVFGPTGIGVVYGKHALLEQLPPWQGGGNMISDVTFERTQYHGAPTRFEAGTGNIADAVGLGAAIDYVERIGMDNIARYEHDLLAYATHGLQTVSGLRLIGTARDKASVLSFVLDGYSTEEVGQALNQEGIAVRSGHHCAQPILRRFGLEATVRPSLAFYNTCAEVDTLVAALRRLAAARHRHRH